MENYPLANIITLNRETENGSGIQHPNRRLYDFLKKVETLYISNSKETNVFELVLNKLTEEQYEHPCSEH